MRSKRITRLEHQLSENIKITQNKIWSGVTKDVSYLRRILNEIYMLKFKVRTGSHSHIENLIFRFIVQKKTACLR